MGLLGVGDGAPSEEVGGEALRNGRFPAAHGNRWSAIPGGKTNGEIVAIGCLHSPQSRHPLLRPFERPRIALALVGHGCGVAVGCV